MSGYRVVSQKDGKVVAERRCVACYLQTCECLLDVCEIAKRAAKRAALDGETGEFYVETFEGVRLTTRTPVKDPAAPRGRNLPPLSRVRGGRRAA